MLCGSETMAPAPGSVDCSAVAKLACICGAIDCIMLLKLAATAKLPYVGSSFGETINQILHTQAEAIARLNDNWTPEFEYVVRKCMQKEQARRYGSAAELIIDLQNLQEGGTSSAAAEGSASPADFDPSDTAIGQAMQDTHTISVEEVRNSDVLISCAEVDDQTFVPGSEGWVAKLQDRKSVV